MSKPSDLVDRLDLVKRQHAGAQVVPLPPPNPLKEACRETLSAYRFFTDRDIDPLIAAQLAGIALDNIMEEE